MDTEPSQKMQALIDSCANINAYVLVYCNLLSSLPINKHFTVIANGHKPRIRDSLRKAINLLENNVSVHIKLPNERPMLLLLLLYYYNYYYCQIFLFIYWYFEQLCKSRATG